MTTLHGIKSCDSVRKARRWLDQNGVEYTYRDLRDQPPSREELQTWLARCDWQQLLNRRSTTWKALPAATRAGATDAGGALELLLSHPTLIKRPVLTTGDDVRVGFSGEEYAATLLPG